MLIMMVVGCCRTARCKQRCSLISGDSSIAITWCMCWLSCMSVLYGLAKEKMYKLIYKVYYKKASTHSHLGKIWLHLFAHLQSSSLTKPNTRVIITLYFYALLRFIPRARCEPVPSLVRFLPQSKAAVMLSVETAGDYVLIWWRATFQIEGYQGQGLT